MDLSPTLLAALLGGILPALLWLAFWLLEDRCQPEPKWRIFLTFLAGMAMVPLVLPVETFAKDLLAGTSLLFVWAVCEETFKLAAAWLWGLRSRAYDEPLDAVIYMVTAALGFSAAENVLFLMQPLGQSNVTQAIVTGDLRFIGATLLHTLASATIGLCMAHAFYEDPLTRRGWLTIGVILAVALHTLFNFFILSEGSGMTFSVFLAIWAGIAVVLLLLERVKHPAKDYC